MSDIKEIMDLFKYTIASQQLAVLSTQKGGEPYANLIAFITIDNYRSLIFVTGRNTRKYDNMKTSKDVAVLLDSRHKNPVDFDNIVAITALGKVVELTNKDSHQIKKVYIDKYPHLETFFESPSNSLMKIDVERYIVASFNNLFSINVDEIA
jgi:nitroimidazol reductase NimA-like FMN-containing flavoprotein (pyridoxamine 5'-phosphate oxidase superfamily)